jgi:hypothetical protein
LAAARGSCAASPTTKTLSKWRLCKVWCTSAQTCGGRARPDSRNSAGGASPAVHSVSSERSRVPSARRTPLADTLAIVMPVRNFTAYGSHNRRRSASSAGTMPGSSRVPASTTSTDRLASSRWRRRISPSASMPEMPPPAITMRSGWPCCTSKLSLCSIARASATLRNGMAWRATPGTWCVFQSAPTATMQASKSSSRPPAVASRRCAGCSTVTRSCRKRCPACPTMAARSRRSACGVFTLDSISWMLGIHSKCLPGSMTVTEWRRDNLMAAVRPAKLPPTMTMRLRLMVMGSLSRSRSRSRSCAVWPGQ